MRGITETTLAAIFMAICSGLSERAVDRATDTLLVFAEDERTPAKESGLYRDLAAMVMRAQCKPPSLWWEVVRAGPRSDSLH